MGIRVQQAANGLRACQALPRMLTMNIHQLARKFLELGGGDGAAVDPGAAFSLRIDRAAQQQGFTRFKAGLLQVRFQPRRAVKFCADFAAGSAFAHHASIGACAQHQLQSANQDRFSSARFTRERRKSIGQIEVHFADDDEIAQANAFKAHDSIQIRRRSRRRSGHAFIPVQFFAQGIEVAPALGMQKTHLELRAPDDDPVAV